MSKKIDFSKYEFRCSQLSLITGRSLLSISTLDNEIKDLLEEKLTLTSKTGRTIKWTETKQKSLDSKQTKRKESSVVNGLIIPKTMQSELRKIYRMEKYNRNFPFTNAYVQKGIRQEEEAITAYQDYRNKKGIQTYFKKNTQRLKNGWLSGEWDLPLLPEIKKTKEGFDIKCPWALKTFPFAEDDLVGAYKDQNNGYMWLTGAEKWTTVYVLVNGTEHSINNEKIKWELALTTAKQGSPVDDPEHPFYSEYIEKCREIEKMMIYDYDRFMNDNSGHQLEIKKDEWYGEGYDIPLNERVLEKTVERDESAIEFYKERIIIGREYLLKLNGQ